MQQFVNSCNIQTSFYAWGINLPWGKSQKKVVELYHIAQDQGSCDRTKTCYGFASYENKNKSIIFVGKSLNETLSILKCQCFIRFYSEFTCRMSIVFLVFIVVLSSCLNVTSELFRCLELLDVREYRRLSDVRMDFGFSFDAAPTIDTVLYFGVSELSEMNKDKIEIDKWGKGILGGLRSSRTV